MKLAALKSGVKTLLWIVLMSFLLATALYYFGRMTTGCRSAININVKQQAYDCEQSVTGSDGTITFEKCIKTDGTGDQVDQESEGGPGDENLKTSLLFTGDARLN